MQVDKPETKEPVCDNTSENTNRVGQAEQAAEAAECRGQGSNWAAKGKSQHHQCSLPAKHSSSCAPAQGPEPLTLPKAPDTSQGSPPWATGAQATARISSVNPNVPGRVKFNCTSINNIPNCL